MEAKDSLVKIVNALIEIGIPVTRQLLTDFLMGKESRDIQELHLDEMENYGVGESHDEDFWTSIIDAAYEQGYLKEKSAKSATIVASATGKKFAKKPTSFIVNEDDEPASAIRDDKGLDVLLMAEQPEKTTREHVASAHTKQQIKIIQAVDRKIALDDFAESESIGLDEVLDELEALVRSGRKMDITYFTDEVLGEDCMEELLDFFSSVKKDKVKKAVDELGDVYNEEEIRLAYIVYLSNEKMENGKRLAKA